MNAYHVTTPGVDVAAAERIARTQQDRIEAIFRRCPWRQLSPSQVLAYLTREHREHGGPRPPLITSVRRAMTNLTNEDVLIHHETLVPGLWGGLPPSWHATHWMPLPEPPNDQ